MKKRKKRRKRRPQRQDTLVRCVLYTFVSQAYGEGKEREEERGKKDSREGRSRKKNK